MLRCLFIIFFTQSCMLAEFVPPERLDADPNYVRFRLGFRYNTQFNKESLDQTNSSFQYMATVKYSAGLLESDWGQTKLRAISGAGPFYTVSLNEFATTMDRPTRDHEYNVRQIYLQQDYEDWRG
ncbi:MAG: hypothetical protein AAGF10_05965, partial [Verrucomicrobiota bacterium]